ncbi:hypothetical protein OJ996_09670 [Luteolibacter sp. GHJ8]|uniref:PepSY-associated transmembrane protein n=1 Tax=Luteolibacter rhizosphaerae TaxID=2989719 RepID=A0ABT3G1Z0_9BACT|nr:hypothetical protein [Luteolibacter rhizosphaerae]MCW1913842.1 hypothetical protein [Luteolibacter rhizosphaerae]
MKLALHRSITFWSGILMMVFICWAWWDSLKSTTQPMWGSCMMESQGGALSFTYRPSGRRPGWEFFRNDYSRPISRLFPAPHFIRGGIEHADPKTRQSYATKSDGAPMTPRESDAMNMMYRTDRDWLLSIPFWLHLLAFALLWSILLLWRAKRRNKAAETTPLLRGSTQT